MAAQPADSDVTRAEALEAARASLPVLPKSRDAQMAVAHTAPTKQTTSILVARDTGFLTASLFIVITNLHRRGVDSLCCSPGLFDGAIFGTEPFREARAPAIGLLSLGAFRTSMGTGYARLSLGTAIHRGSSYGTDGQVGLPCNIGSRGAYRSRFATRRPLGSGP